jgi:hypothetical protein
VSSLQRPKQKGARTRAGRLRRELVVELCRQRGTFWNAVECARDSFSIEATEEVPAKDTVWRAPPLPLAALRDLPVPTEPAPEGVSSFQHFSQHIGPALQEISMQHRTRWDKALTDLIHAFVPDDCRGGLLAGYHWPGFMALCIYHDPPADQLLQFADLWDVGELEGDHWMAIRYLYDGGDVLTFASQSVFRALEHLANRLHTIGVEIDPVDEYRSLSPSIAEAWGASHPSAIPAIVVSPETSKKDVQTAFSQLHALNPDRGHRGPGRPARDRLVYLQAGLLVVKFGWTREQVADHLGFNKTEDVYGNQRRSAAANGHIDEGIRMLGVRKSKPKNIPGN